MIRNVWCAVIGVALWFGACPVRAAEPETTNDSRFQEQVRGLAAEHNEVERLRRALELVGRQPLSSLQVKAIAARLSDDAARLKFATAAYPRTIDPENYYEVYDAFTSFSKVLRLHDWIRQSTGPQRSPVVVAPRTVTAEEMRGFLQAVRKESFDQTRDKVARQILSSSRKKFLAAQIKEMVACFDFEPSRLEFAKYAYDFTFDRDKYNQVNDALEFSSTRESLSSYIQSRNPSSPPPRR